MRPYPDLNCFVGALMLGLAGCATAAVTAESIRPPDPAFAYHAIEAEPTLPAQIIVRDFEFAPSSVIENRSAFHRAIDLFRSSSAKDRRIAIGRQAAATLSVETAKQLGRTGLLVTRTGGDSDMPLEGNFLVVTGRLIDVDEGNRFARIALGVGLGESRLATEVHVFRVVNDEKAEVLVFTTYADSGKMPGIGGSIFTLGIGVILGPVILGPATVVKAIIKDAVSGGIKIYSSQIDHLASETGDQVARYLSQYAAAERWIPPSKAKRVHLAG